MRGVGVIFEGRPHNYTLTQLPFHRNNSGVSFLLRHGEQALPLPRLFFKMPLLITVPRRLVFSRIIAGEKKYSSLEKLAFRTLINHFTAIIFMKPIFTMQNKKEFFIHNKGLINIRY